MNEHWRQFLLAQGAELAVDEVRAFGGSNGLEHARQGAFMCDLSAHALLEFVGPDAEAFLHAQLTSDVKALPDDQCQLAAYNSPKGRILAILLLWRIAQGFAVQLPRAIADGVRKRLSMFILRSNVSVRDASLRHVRLGVGGPDALDALGMANIRVPDSDFGLLAPAATGAARYALRLPGDRFELVHPDWETAAADWRALREAGAAPSSGAPWQWLSVRSAIAEVGADTQDKFVPQMLNLELLGAVSFTKGCYPGQEIVARTQYRGEIRRRTFLAHIASERPVAAGDEVTDARTTAGAPVGILAAAAAAPGGGYDVLACLHVDLAQGAVLQVKEGDAVPLEILDLPYELPAIA